MIHAAQIKRNFGTLEVLKGIDLNVKKGEIISIVGASGAGKTTLLQIIGTLDKPTAGKLTINNTDLSTLSGNKLSLFRNKNIGFVFQSHMLLPEFSALENTIIPAMISNTKKSEAQKRAIELLSHLGLSDRLQHRPSELSGGEQQRVSVARALINNPAIILADEPSGNLDSKNAQELHELFFDLRDKFNQTFVIATHNETLANMADRKIVMQDGRIVKSE